MKIKDISYIIKYSRFTANTFLVLNSLWTTGVVSDLLKLKENKKSKIYKKILKQFGNGGLVKVNARAIIEDEAILNEDFPNSLFLANHRSMADVLSLFYTAPKSMRFVAKSSLFKIPYFGQTMRYIGTFEIDRKNKETSIKSLEVASQKLKEGFDSVVMFPEGSRSRDKNLLPFKKGAFYLAIKSGAPIVPVSISNSEKILPYGAWRMKDGEITVHYGKPIITKGLTIEDIPQLMKDVELAIIKNLDN